MNSEPPPPAPDRIGEQTILFDEFVFALDSKTLWRNHEMVQLAPKTCELLAHFLENAGRVIAKEALMSAVWKNAFVEESNLAHHVAALRKALGEEKTGKAKNGNGKNGKRLIETVPRKGYRFVAPLAQSEKFEVVVTERVETRLIEEEIEAPENPLFGRDREISIIKNILLRRDLRILTLTGAGGSGKTSLAGTIADELEKHFAGNVFFVDLANVVEPAQVLQAIAQTLGAVASYTEEIAHALENRLRNRETLLILDNFEQIVHAAADIGKLSANLPKLKILITSRIRLNLRNEREFAVLPLAVPGNETSLEELAEYASVNLFVERARRVKPDFGLTDENVGTIAEICRRLEGLPLAIELAAAKTRFLSAAAILEKLENQLRFLIGGWRDLPLRQKTMRSTIIWSYELLTDPDEKLFFALLAVFSGGFTLEAAEQVFPRSNSSSEILELIDQLSGQSLLIADEHQDGSIRFRALAAIREFALEKLCESGCRVEIEKNHAEYFLTLAEELEPQIRTRRANEIYQKFKIEHDNLRRALDYFRSADAEKYLRLATAIGFYWATHALFREGRARIEDALVRAQPAASPQQRALANKAAAIIAAKQGDYQAAEKNHAETLRIAEVLRDEKLQANAFNGLGTVAYLCGDYAKAQTHFARGLELSRKLGEEALTLVMLVGLGEAKRIEGDWQAVRALTEESMVYINRRELKRPFIGAQINFGVVAFMQQNFAAAEKHFETARELVQPADRHGLSLCLDGFAALAAARGETEQALTLAHEADKIRREIGYRLELPDQMFRDFYFSQIENQL